MLDWFNEDDDDSLSDPSTEEGMTSKTQYDSGSEPAETTLSGDEESLSSDSTVEEL